MKKYLIITLSIVFLYSCSEDFLMENNPTSLTSESVYTNQQGLELGIVALYSLQRAFYEGSQQDYAITPMRGDDISVSRGAHDMGAALYNQALTPRNGTVGYIWGINYRIIERANSILSGLSKLDDISESAKNQIESETKVFRARSYFILIRYFDNIILKLEPTEGIETEFSPANPEDVYQLIVADLDFAISKLTYQAPAGRFTKGAAQHLRADVALWLKDWGKAEQQAKSIINEGPYGLLDDVNKIFEGMVLNHKESIFVFQFERGVVGGGQYHRFAQYFTPLYNEIVGMRISHDQGGRSWGRTFPNPYLISLYQDNDARLNAFYRRHWTFNNPARLPKGKSLGDTIRTQDVSDAFRQLSPASTKYWDSERDITSAESYKDIIHMRLAETYFIAAEALMRQGKIAEALQYINAIRKRAGVDDLTNLSEDILLEERAKELAFEGHRWFELKRMGKLIERVRMYGGSDQWPQVRENIRDFHVRRPIPQAEIDLMPGYPQNEGYQ